MRRFAFMLLAIICIVFMSGNISGHSEVGTTVSFFVSDDINEDLLKRSLEDEAFSKQGYLLEHFTKIKEEIPNDLFGGAYFDEIGDLHIQVCTYDIKLTSYEGVIYEKVKYSLNELIDYQNLAIENREKIGFKSSGIRQNINKIVLYAPDTIDIELLNSIIPNDAYEVVIEIGDSFNCTSVTVVPGTRITNTTTNYSGSISCGVVWNNSTTNKKYGFMTAGHLGSVGNTVSYQGYPMGMISAKQESGSVDAALILRGQNSTVFNYSDSLYDGKNFPYNGGTFPQNTTIYAYGYKTTYVNGIVMNGCITDINYSDTFDSIPFTNLIKTDTVCAGGDSGGPVITAYSNGYSIIGIIKGTSNGNMVYVNMENIKTTFDLNVVTN